MKKIGIWSLLFILCGTFAIPGPSAHAAFDLGSFISDFEMTHSTSLSRDEIEEFLKRQGSVLTTYADPQTRLSAAQIIYDTAQQFRINPKVILVTLQKEQSLIKNGSTRPDQYDWAMGYGICDDCSKDDPLLQKFKGFYNQIFYSTRRLREFMDKSSSFYFKPGVGYVIDNEPVFIANAATAALINYTPHRHGNEIFHWLWNKWFQKFFPDGAVLQNSDTGAVYLIQNGKKRLFTSKSVLLSRYDLSDILPASKNDLDTYMDGTPIRFAENSLLRSPGGTIYLLTEGVRRGITSPEVFRKIGFNPDELIDATWSDLNEVPEGDPITESSIYPGGALLQDKTTGGVYFVKDGVKHPIISKDIMLTNYPYKKIQPATPDALASYTTGDAVLLKDGTLIKTKDTNIVYVVSNGMKRPILSELAFTTLGYRYENILTTAQNVIDLHPTGDVIEMTIEPETEEALPEA